MALCIKQSKCSFAQTQVEYLGHIISRARVGTNPKKIETIVTWPKPLNIRALRGFLGLTGYYKRFMKKYGTINKPLTELLNEGFNWNHKAEEAFEQLKKALSEVPTLGLPDFSNPFTLEIDASDTGVGAVLSLEGKPLAFLS